MAMGFVYVLVNPAMPELVKIGLTINTSEERAKELRTTGVPSKFVVVYDELVSDCGLVESKMHERFSNFREAGDREFFRMPVKIAVRGLREEAGPYLVPESALQIRCEILTKLHHKFPKCLARNLTSVAVIQVTDSDSVSRLKYPTDPDGEPEPTRLIILESRSRPAPGQHEIIVEQVDLSFIYGIENDFPVDGDIKESAAAFVKKLNLATLLVTSGVLLNEEGNELAMAEYNSGRPPEPSEPEDSGNNSSDRVR